MKLFNYNNREYINPVDLNVLGATYNTLEQGHKEAVKAASDLEVAMANLDLNEAEAGWRQQQIAEIKQTVAENTKYGNAYGALDDIITKAGNIASNQGMIGRLQAQKDYKEFKQQLDARTDIPEAYKEMYREENPYYYKDTIDEKTGAVVGGSKWQPISRPTQSINYFEVMKNGLSIAAKESGKSGAIRFLDANNRPTSDPSQSVSGEVYDERTQQWERLSADKIKAGIDSALASTPGARESLQQDYKYATWKYGKDVAANGGKPLVQSGVTDRDGNLLTFDNFVNEKTTNFVNAAKYSNVYSDTRFGTALQTARQAAAKSAGTGTGALGEIINSLGNVKGAATIGTVETDVNNYATATNNRTNANDTALSVLRKYSPNTAKGFDNVSDFIQFQMKSSKAQGPGTAVSNYIKWIERDGKTKMSAEDKDRLYKSTMGYYKYNENTTKMEKGLSKQDRDALRFSSGINEGRYVAGRSSYDDNIITANNNLWKDVDNVDITLSPNLVKALSARFGVNNLSDLGVTTSSRDGDTVLSFRSENRNLLPRFMSVLDKADDEDVGASWRGIRNKFRMGQGNKDYTITMSKDGQGGLEIGRTGLLQTMRNNFNHGVDRAANAEKSAGVNKGILSVETSGKNSFRELELQGMYGRGMIGSTDYNAMSKFAEENVNNKFASASFDAGQLYDAGEGNNFAKVDNPQDMQNLISYMYSNDAGNIRRSTVIMSGVPDKVKGNNAPMKGYVLNFTVPANAPVASAFKGKKFKLMYAGNLEEDVTSDPALSTGNVAYSTFNAAKATKTPATMIEYNNYLGNTDVTPNPDGSFSANFAGASKKVSDNEASEYLKYLYTLDQVKHTIHAMNGQVDPAMVQQNIEQISRAISASTGKDVNSVRQSITNYLIH